MIRTCPRVCVDVIPIVCQRHIPHSESMVSPQSTQAVPDLMQPLDPNQARQATTSKHHPCPYTVREKIRT